MQNQDRGGQGGRMYERDRRTMDAGEEEDKGERIEKGRGGKMTG